MKKRKHGDLVTLTSKTQKLASAQCLVRWGMETIADRSYVTENVLDVLRRFEFGAREVTTLDLSLTFSVIGDISLSNGDQHIVIITPEGMADGVVYAVIDDENLLDAVVDMTKEEIEEALGYKINIVEEDGE